MQIAAVLDSGRVYALDIHAHKVGLIEKNAELCGVTKYVTAKKTDARKAKEEFDEESFDKVLIDAPCSGLGLMRRKPEVKYDKHFKDSLSLHDVQVGILDQVAELVKPGIIIPTAIQNIIKPNILHITILFLCTLPLSL